jgi:FkbM family methyltransferase
MFPPSFQDVNKKITEKYLNYNNGFFIEVGGADGFTQSNTWHLENFKNWKGILVEPNISAYHRCKEIRKNSKVFNCALVSNEYANETIKVIHRNVYQGDPGLMSAIEDSPIRKDEGWLAKQTDIDHTTEFSIQARTLNSILEECNVESIDFFSLDVEGYEIEVLRGLNIKKYLPKILLIEWHLNIAEIENCLGDEYRLEEQLSKHDYVFTVRN